MYATSDSESYHEAIRRADAVVLIGGLDGTREVFERADRGGEPVFPLVGTGGDAYEVLALLREDVPHLSVREGLDRPMHSPR